MTNEKFNKMIQGPVTILFTPFEKDGSKINEEQLRLNIRYMLDHGLGKECGVLVTGGSTGDCYILSVEERKRLFEVTLEETKGRCPVFCGINSTSTEEAIELAQFAEKCGADGVMATPPFYWINPTPETTYQHYKALSDNCSLGIMIYNNPNIIAQDISLDTLKRLAEIEHVVALKECSGNTVKFKLVVEELGDKMVIINGAGEWIEPLGYQMGTPAFISGYTNFYPEQGVLLHKLCSEKRYEEAAELVDKFRPLKKILWNSVQKYGPSVEAKVYKEMADVLGFNEGGERLPIMPCPAEIRSELEQVLPEIKF